MLPLAAELPTGRILERIRRLAAKSQETGERMVGPG
jgi:hypothetical protein